MINKIYIKNFKSFDEEEISLNSISLLTGPNSSGKSSVIQALLLLAHNVDKREDIKNKIASPLNSYKVSLGEFSEIRNKNKNAKEIVIGVKSNQDEIKIMFMDDLDSVNVEFLKEASQIETIFKSYNRKLHYLSANRIGVQDLYNKNINNFDKYGALGEFAIDFYNSNKSEVLDSNLIIDKSSETLSTQVNYWLKYILNCNIETQSVNGSDKIQTSFSLILDRKISSQIRPKNLGSGLSYIISILIMCLSSNKGDILIIENPEIHLHPRAQSLLTDFLVFAANAGIQLIIETHSDHIFNGIRKAINKNQIKEDKVALNFFDISEKNLCTKYTKIEFNEKGQPQKYPEGLFDQFDTDLNELLGLN